MNELEMRFGGRIRIYVESTIDSDLYGRLVGGNAYEPLSFDAPPSGGEDTEGGGYRSVEKVLRAARDTTGDRRTVWGLLDGEESLRFGRGCELFERPQLVFTIDDPDCQGMLFLGCHEKENLYLRYGGAATMIAERVSADRAERRNGHFEIQRRRCLEVARTAALLRFAAKTTWFNRTVKPQQEKPEKSAEDLFELCNRLRHELMNYDDAVRRILDFWPDGPYRETFHSEIARISATMEIDAASTHFRSQLDGGLLALVDGRMMMQMGFGQDLSRATRDIEHRMVEGDFSVVFRNAILNAIAGRSVHRSGPADGGAHSSDGSWSSDSPLAGAWRIWPVNDIT